MGFFFNNKNKLIDDILFVCNKINNKYTWNDYVFKFHIDMSSDHTTRYPDNVDVVERLYKSAEDMGLDYYNKVDPKNFLSREEMLHYPIEDLKKLDRLLNEVKNQLEFEFSKAPK